MRNFVVEILSQTVSFRIPDFQNFHKSFNLPPPTTIVGLSGAALGLSPMKAQEFFEVNSINIGVFGLHKGKCSDTWKYNKRTKEMWLYKPEKDGSIIQKEFLIYNRYLIAFSSISTEAIARLLDAYIDPVYALTLGNSDSLAFVKSIKEDLTYLKNNEIENCIVEGDVIDNVINQASINFEFSIYQTSEPIAYDLPVKFTYSHDYGRRTVNKTSTFSIVSKKMKLNFDIEGLEYDGIFIPLLNLHK